MEDDKADRVSAHELDNWPPPTKSPASGDVVAEEALGNDLPQGYFTSIHFIATLSAGGLGCLSGYLGWSLAANSLTFINDALGPSPDFLWLPLAYTLCNAVASVLVGRISDIFGRRWFLLVGHCLALVGAILGATAQTINTMVASNVFVGTAAAAQFAHIFFLPELVPKKARGLAIGFCYTVAVPGSCFGPIIAKAFISRNPHDGWRWSYYLMIITTSITIALMYLYYHPPTFSMLHVTNTKMQKIKALDYGGIVLFSGGFILFLLGINWGGVFHLWKSAHVIACIVVGCLMIIGFCVYEAYIPSDPLIPLSIMKNTEFMMIVLVACAGGMIYYSMTVLWPTICTLFTDDILYNGWLSMSVSGGFSLGTIVCSITFGFGRVRWQLMAAVVIFVGFVGAEAATTQYTKNMSVAFAIVGLFFAGFTEGLVNATVSFTVPAEDIGLAVGVSNGLRVLAGGVATAIYNSIMANQQAKLHARDIPPAVLDAGLPRSSLATLMSVVASGGSTASLQKIPGVTSGVLAALADAEKDALAGSVKLVFLVSLAFGGVGIVATFFIKNVDSQLNNVVNRRLHGHSR
ncbi:hypothetical protein AYO21_00779 [Fonsecaea monophora]|uniref:Major facilitator superfamily (MFS) profile domain-containing protein n=1 Tax=Fonsecaea monophora TaxID=254056 RepID=A0A177FKM4_9EURO|nr:hypothetical protein AYO21_00779 [Fonsecaea monophora]OAG44818.1 hypothetical protein AYO21_00779 [Fonsecaea monophora]